MPSIERRSRVKSRGSSRIAIINRSCGIGDVLALRTLLRSLAVKYCDYQIDIVVPANTHQFLKDHPIPSRILDPRLFREDQFEKIFDLSGSTDRHLKRSCLDVWSKKLEIPIPQELDAELNFTQRDIERASKLVKKVSPEFRPIILICPFGSLRSKRMSIESINETTNHLKDIGWCPIVIHKENTPGLDCVQLTDLTYTILLGLFSLCDGVISVATSHLWLGALLGKPIVALTGEEEKNNYTNHFKNLIAYSGLKVKSSVLSDSLKELGIRPIVQKVVEDDSREIVGIRVCGLLGDGIKATTLLGGIPDKNVLLMCSYKDPDKHRLLRSLFSDLIGSGRVVDFISSPEPGSVKMTSSEIEIFKSHGCQSIYDGNIFTEEFRCYKKGIPYLGFKSQKQIDRRVCLMRRSHLHSHFPERNRPYSEWVKIEEFLINNGFKPEIIGVDDPMPNDFDLPDYRNLLDPLQSLKRACSAEIVISTATYIPVFTNYFIPTFVLSDPRDIDDLKTKWYNGGFAKVFDVTGSYINEMKDCIKREFLI